MSNFASRVASMDTRIANRFSDQTAVFHYHVDKSSSRPVAVVPKNPVMEEDYVPGSATAGQAVGVLILWFRSTDTTGTPIIQPVKGDVVSYGSGDYDITRIGVDREGAVTAWTRLRAQRWDQ